MHFVIAGKINCPQFSFAIMVAQRLKESLPDFTYMKIPKHPQDWDRWLICFCKENHWYHVQSPLIWREIGLKKGKKEFIGSINKFLDICNDYYGVPHEVLAADSFNKAEMNWFKNRTESEYFEDVKLEGKKKRKYKSRQVCITGATSQMAEIIIMEILRIRLQSREDGLEIRLFDDPSKEAKLTSSANDGKHCPGLSGFGNCRVATTLKEALNNVDLVIVLDSFTRKPKESLVKWLKRNRNAMCALGKGLNAYAPPHCRVIIGSPSNQPICYNATVLASFATKLHVRNIVVVTQDLGRETLKFLSDKINVPMTDLYCPPVWGFIGLNKFIDIPKTLQNYVYKVPGKRPESNLPQGSEELEVRTVDCLLNEEEMNDIHVKVSNYKAETYPQLGRWPCLAKAIAIVDLLKVWGFKQEDGNGEVLCLGVYSDGTFNIPKGIFWSQPVILKNGFWVPFSEYPVPREYDFNGYYLFIVGLAALYRTKVKPRRYVPPVHEPRSQKKKFNFDKILEEVGVPVIRTDSDCLKRLKELAKKELGIDFDAVDFTFDEEEPEVILSPEPVVREQLYCECWREELKELQKVVFHRASSTEIEVDLSENLSGSEWSVINLHPHVSSGSGTVSPSFITSPSQKILFSSSSTTEETICTCGALSTGSTCKCLGSKKGIMPEVVVNENVSTEHFYKEQNVQIFEDGDFKDIIYEDTYKEVRRVSFDPSETAEDKVSQLPRKFYGKKDAIRDPMAELNIKTRILKYEKGSEESLKDESGDVEESQDDTKEKESGPKYHISIEGASYDIIGDKTGFESLEMKRNDVDHDSVKSFREMYTDEIAPPLQVIPPDFDKSESSSETYSNYPEDEESGNGSLRNNSESKEEHSSRDLSMSSTDHTIKTTPKKKIVIKDEKDRKSDEKEESFERKEKEERKEEWGREKKEDQDKRVEEYKEEESKIEGKEKEKEEDKGEEGEEEEGKETEAEKVEEEHEAEGEDENEYGYMFDEKGTEIEEEGKYSEEWGESEQYSKVTSEETSEKLSKIPKWKREGIPLCCLCRCIVPEGLPCCPCGSTTVVEVFKKESVEVFIQSEDDISYRIEYFERFLPTGGTVIIPDRITDVPPHPESVEPDRFSDDFDFAFEAEVTEEPPVKEELPPESFFPFSPKHANIFREHKRPFELTKEYIDMFKEKSLEEMPRKCVELLNMAKAKLEEKSQKGDVTPEEDLDDEARRVFLETCTNEEPKIKTDFSNLNLFIPEGIEDWRLTVQMKYREWFFSGPKINDESYYDMAVEEVSEDEFEVDKEIEKYFET